MPKESFKGKSASEKYEEIQSLIKQIDEGVKNVFESERFKEYLKFCSSFTNYSANNTLLIAIQKPDATFVASFKKWQELGRSVDKGQHGIQILAPVSVKTGGYLETQREVVDDLGMKQYNEDGTVKTETVEEPIKELRFKKVHVFDVSQTSGKELPTLMDELSGDIDNDRKNAMLSGVQKAVQIPVEFEDIRTNAKGYFDSVSQRIAIKNGMSDFQTLKTAFHEAAHKLLHDRTQNTPTSSLSKNDREVQAEATAFIVANKYGIDTSEYSFPYIASWSEGKELKQLKGFLDEIQNAAKQICKNIDNELLKLKKRNLNIDELLSDTELTNVQKAEILIDRKINEGYSIAPEKADKILDNAAKTDNIGEIKSAIDKAAEKTENQQINVTDNSEKAYIDNAINDFFKHYSSEVMYTIDDITALPESDKKKIADMYNKVPFDEEIGNYEVDEKLDREIYKLINLNELKNKVIKADLEEKNIVISDIETKKAFAEDFLFSDLTMGDEDYADNFKDGIRKITFTNSKNESISFTNYYDMKNEIDNPQGFFSRNTQKDISVEDSHIPPEQPSVDNNIGYGYSMPEPPPIDNNNGYGYGMPEPPPIDNNIDYGYGMPEPPPIDNNIDYGYGMPEPPPIDNNIDYGYGMPEPPPIDNNIGYGYGMPEPPPVNNSVDYIPPEPDYNINYPIPNNYEQKVTVQENVRKSEDKKQTENQTEKKSSNIIGNTPYNQLGKKSDLKYFHASPEMTDKIIKQLEADGVKFSGLRRSEGTTFTVNKSDSEKYSKAVAVINAENNLNERKSERKPKNPDIFGTVLYAELENAHKFKFKDRIADLIAPELEKNNIKFAGYKKDGITYIAISEKDVPKLKKSVTDIQNTFARESCREFISANINKAFESRSVKEFIGELEKKFGVDNAMYVIGKSISENPDKYPKKLAENVKQFNYPKTDLLKSIDNIQPTLIGALYNDLATRQKELNPPKEPPKPELSEYFKDKHLLPYNRKYLDKDENGFPVTKYEKTSADEYYVQGYGWLDNEGLEKARKESNNPHEFGKLITKANVRYVDDSGRTGQADIDYNEYKLFTQITYSKENEERYQAAKDKLDERMKNGNAIENPTEFYAVSRVSENKYNIVTIGTDGTPDIVKEGLSKKEAAAMIENIYYQKDSECINCDIISNSELTKKCTEIYQKQLEEVKKLEGEDFISYDVSFSDKKYAVLPNPNTSASEKLSHFVQEYVKDGDRYKAVGVPLVGTYDECRAFTDKVKAEEKEPPKTMKIYQVKEGEQYHNVRFSGTKELAVQNLRPDFRNYEKTYELPVSELPKAEKLSELLEKVFQKFNTERPSDFTGRSLSVSDVVVLDKKPFFVDSVGFKGLKNFLPEQNIETLQNEFMDNFKKRASELDTPEKLQEFMKEAKKLGIECEIESPQKPVTIEEKPNKQSIRPMKRGGH